MRVTGCNPVTPWKCAVIWGLIGVAGGFWLGIVLLGGGAACS
jgi:hypothetical protein